jgi:hypothetical protein
MSSNDPRLPVRAMDGSRFTTVDEDGSVREYVRFRGAWVPLLVDVDTFERIAAGDPVYASFLPIRVEWPDEWTDPETFLTRFDTPALRGETP